MNDPIAIFYESKIIYWNSIVIAAAFLAALFLCLTLYLRDHGFGIVVCAYWLISGAGGVYLSRIIHWYCRMEQYPDFKTAVTKLEKGGYSILGVLLASWLTALLFSALRLIKSRYEILNAAAPSLAFVLAMIRFCDVFSGACLGKHQLGNGTNIFLYTTEIGGIEQTRLAVFNISFLWLLGVTVITLVLFLLGKKEVYRIFIILFCVSEIFVDSIRYDSLHMFFYGGKLQDFNKVAGFIGLAELAAGLILLGYMILFFVRMMKKICRVPVAEATEEAGEAGEPAKSGKSVVSGKSKKNRKSKDSEESAKEGDLVILEEARDSEGLEILEEPDLMKETEGTKGEAVLKDAEITEKPEKQKKTKQQKKAEKTKKSESAGETKKTEKAEKPEEKDNPEEAKARKKTKIRKILLAIALLVLFIIGFVIVCVCEYLVQRYTGEYVRWYVVQTIGSFLMGFCCLFSLICIKRL